MDAAMSRGPWAFRSTRAHSSPFSSKHPTGPNTSRALSAQSAFVPTFRFRSTGSASSARAISSY